MLYNFIYGQKDGICGCLAEDDYYRSRYDKPVSWTNHKHIRVPYSSFCAGLLSADDSDDIVFDLKHSMRYITPPHNIIHDLYVVDRAF